MPWNASHSTAYGKNSNTLTADWWQRRYVWIGQAVVRIRSARKFAAISTVARQFREVPKTQSFPFDHFTACASGNR